MRVARGLAFNVCLDRGCESLDAAVKQAFDREWACPEPDCDGDLRILRRGASSPAASSIPTATPVSPSPPASPTANATAGSPTFETASGTRCLDATCDRGLEASLEAESAADD